MQFIKRFRVGQRAIKTAISVGLALALAMVLGSSLPIFAAIGAISVMSRTWVDSLKESLNQIAGTFLGYLIACVFVTVLPNPTFFVWMALGVLCVISLCIGLKLNFAIPLASIVFADVCLYTGGDSIVYGFHRFTDTLVGLVVALLVNVVIRPYNNRQKIINTMDEIQKMFLPLLQSRVLEHRYPDLTPLTEKMTSLASELRIFEKQPVALWQHAVRVAARRQEAAYLKGMNLLSLSDQDFFPQVRFPESKQGFVQIRLSIDGFEKLFMQYYRKRHFSYRQTLYPPTFYAKIVNNRHN